MPLSKSGVDNGMKAQSASLQMHVWLQQRKNGCYQAGREN